MNKVAFITGIFGQDAYYLSKLLIDKGYDVWGMMRRSSSSVVMENFIKEFGDRVKLRYGDMTDQTSIRNIISECKPDEIYSLAAQSHVKISYDMPEYTAQVNALGVMYLLSAAKDIVPSSRIYQACHDVDTRVIAKKGIVSYTEMSEGDEVYTLNTTSMQMELKKIKKIHVYDYIGDLLKFNGQRIDKLVTPNHKFVLDISGNIEYVNASDIKNMGSDRVSNISLVVPKPHFVDTDEKIYFKDYVDYTGISNHCASNLIDSMNLNDFMYLLGLYIGDGYFTTKKRGFVNKKEFSNREVLTGRYLKVDAEKVEKIYDSHYILFAIPKKDHERDKVVSVLKRNNIDFREKEMTIDFSCFPLSFLFRQCGISVYKKHIPDFAWNFPDSVLVHLFDGLMGSDGHIRKNNKDRGHYFTSSLTLVKDVIVLCTRLGKFCSYSTSPAGDFLFKSENRIIHGRENYVINICSKKTNRIYKSIISEQSYSGKVWCFEIEDNPNFMVCRNGKVCFSGNSTSEMMGRTNPPQNENSLFQPTSPYGTAKLHAYWEIRNARNGHNMFACNGILFNHESMRRGENFVTRKITSAVAKIVTGQQGSLSLGNLDAKRDWGFAGDYTKAMFMILQHHTPDDYVVATGKAYTVRAFLEKTLECAGIPYRRELDENPVNEKYFHAHTGDLLVDIDPRFYRPVEVDYLLGDSTKIRTVLGWKPEVSFEQLVQMMYENDLKICKGKS